MFSTRAISSEDPYADFKVPDDLMVINVLQMLIYERPQGFSLRFYVQPVHSKTQGYSGNCQHLWLPARLDYVYRYFRFQNGLVLRALIHSSPMDNRFRVVRMTFATAPKVDVVETTGIVKSSVWRIAI